jgi:hypothetical protein
MDNNSTNINKTSNNLSPKESLINDGQQFHQYQQNEQPSLTSNHQTNKNMTYIPWGNPWPCLE